LVKQACDKLNIACIPARLAILTKAHNGRPALPLLRPMQPRLHDGVEFQFEPGVVAAAMATGKLTLDYRAMAREIVVGKTGKAEAVSYVDKAYEERKRVLRKSGCRGGECVRIARLLLNSKSTLFPDGIANSSGTVGKYLMDSVGSDGWGEVPALAKMPPHNHAALEACISTCRGGNTTGKLIFRAVTTLRCGRTGFARRGNVSRSLS